MHPFWAVRRLTEAQLKMGQPTCTDKIGKSKPRFNCRLEELPISNVIITAPKGDCLNLTRTITITFSTNSIPFKDGEELIRSRSEEGESIAPQKELARCDEGFTKGN